MANVFVEEQNLQDIADAIREKNGTDDTYKPSEMGSAIRRIESGGGDISKFGIQNEVKGTNLVTLDYVNENEHNVEVQLSSDTITDFSGVEVVATSTNLFDISKFVSNEQSTNNGDGSITLSRYAVNTNNKISECCPYIKVGQTIVFNATNGTKIYFGGAVKPVGTSFEVTQAMLDNGKIGFYGTADTTEDNPLTMTEIRINIDKSLPYEHYVGKTYLANVDGTLSIPSISPIMNLMCNGVDISAKYYCMQNVEWNRFWDSYQDFGSRQSYQSAFGTSCWTNEIFKPKYDIICKSLSYSMFADSVLEGSLTELLNRAGVRLKFIDNSYFSSTFARSKFTEIDFITEYATIPISNLATPFKDCTKLETLKISTLSKVHKFGNTCFQNCNALKNLTMVGEIVLTDLNLQWSSLLSVESVQNIIDCLADLTGQTTQTVTLHPDVEARMSAEQKAIITSKNWTLAVAKA